MVSCHAPWEILKTNLRSSSILRSPLASSNRMIAKKLAIQTTLGLQFSSRVLKPDDCQELRRLGSPPIKHSETSMTVFRAFSGRFGISSHAVFFRPNHIHSYPLSLSLCLVSSSVSLFSFYRVSKVYLANVHHIPSSSHFAFLTHYSRRATPLIPVLLIYPFEFPIAVPCPNIPIQPILSIPFTGLQAQPTVQQNLENILANSPRSLVSVARNVRSTPRVYRESTTSSPSLRYSLMTRPMSAPLENIAIGPE